MTTLNKIIEEEKKVFDTDIRPHIGNHTEGADHGIADDIWERNATAMQRAYEAGQADWLRSEIEKLEGMLKPNIPVLAGGGSKPSEYHKAGQVHGRNQALTSIITRYKEELLELEKGV